MAEVNGRYKRVPPKDGLFMAIFRDTLGYYTVTELTPEKLTQRIESHDKGIKFVERYGGINLEAAAKLRATMSAVRNSRRRSIDFSNLLA